MKQLFALLLILFSAGSVHADPASALSAAFADASNLPYPDTTLYFFQPGGFNAVAYTSADGKRSVTWLQVAKFHLNQMGRKAEFAPVRLVALDVIAVDTLYLDYPRDVMEQLADVEPHFNEVDFIKAGSSFRKYFRDGTGYKRGFYDVKATKDTKFARPGRWLDQVKANGLILLCNTRIPLMRFDWFQNQTGQTEDRVVGYYEMMGFKSRTELQALAGLDIKLATKLDKIDLAALDRSGVANNNRGIERIKTLSGAYWFTKDCKRNTGENNVLRMLNGDLKHDAEEIYFTLPNGLPGYGASDAKGVLQRSVPANIAGNRKSPSNDLEIQVPGGCIQCHLEIIRPFQCDIRLLYSGPKIKLTAVDPFQQAHLRRRYLSDINRLIRLDQGEYVEAIFRCNGTTPADNANAWTAAWTQYIVRDVTLDILAAEMGVPAARIRKAVGDKVIGKSVVPGVLPPEPADPVLSRLWADPPLPIRREKMDEVQGLLWQWLEYKQ